MGGGEGEEGWGELDWYVTKGDVAGGEAGCGLFLCILISTPWVLLIKANPIPLFLSRFQSLGWTLTYPFPRGREGGFEF